VVQYRHVVRDWVRRSRVMTFLKATKFYRIYAGLRG